MWSPLAITCLFGALVFLLRMPSGLFPREMDPDESQMLTQAAKFLLDPVPWRSVDGTSSGPGNSYFLTLFLLLGLKPTYVLAHQAANLLAALQVMVAYRTLLRLTAEKAAALGTIPVAFVFVFSVELWQYSSELLPALLLTVGFHGALSYLRNPDHPARWLVASGLALGLAPWCKLQSLPISGLLALFVAGVLAFSDRRRKFVAHAALFGGAFVLPTALLVAVLWPAGALGDMWQSYVLGNLWYAGDVTLISILLDVVRLLLPMATGPLVFTLLLAIGLLAAARRRTGGLSLASEERTEWWGLTLYLGAAAAAVIRPATFYSHYLVFLIYPLACLTTLLLWRVWQLHQPAAKGALPLGPVARLATLGITLMYAVSLVATMQFVTGIILPDKPIADASPRIAAALNKLNETTPFHSLAIWGWAPGVYVLTGIPPATRDAVGHFVISSGPLQGYFRSRFVGDLERQMPDVFVDAVAPGAFMWSWSTVDGYESDPALKALIDRNYTLAGELELEDNAKPVRLFTRRKAATAGRFPPSAQ